MDALAFLKTSDKSKRQPIVVLAGDEEFLKRQCRAAIIKRQLGNDDPDFAVSVIPGEKTDFTTIRNDLDTVPFLATTRIVVVEQADTFVTANRASLEKYVLAPSKVGILILDVKTFPETTKLAKALPTAAKIQCKAPPINKLPEWCRIWAESHYKKKLMPDAAELLVDRVGNGMGLLDSELNKLAIAVGTESEIRAERVVELVSQTRAADVFKIMDAVGDGQPALAMKLLARLFEQGEDPLAILGPLGYQLRKLAAVGRLIAQGESLGPAMDRAGVPKWPQARQGFEKQVRHLGRRRLNMIGEWLVEINLGLKGGNPLPPRLQMERLIVNLARPRER